jgi:hypothetical protein
MDSGERDYWYNLAEGFGVTQRHAGHMIARLDDRERQLDGLVDVAFTSEDDAGDDIPF